MTTSLKIIDIFEYINENNIDNYCKICLRYDRKTNESSNLGKLLEIINRSNEGYLLGQIFYLCYYCESQVKTTINQLQHFEFALNVHKVFNEMKATVKKKHLINHMMNYEKQNYVPDPEMSDTFQLAVSCQDRINFIRKQTILSTTDVLVVDNKGITANEFLFSVPETSESDKSFKKLPENENVETVDLDDEEDDNLSKPKTGHLKLVNIDVLMKNTLDLNNVAINHDGTQLITRVNKNSLSLLLHPIVTGIDNVKYVPTISARIVDGKLDDIPSSIKKIITLTPETPRLSESEIFNTLSTQHTENRNSNSKCQIKNGKITLANTNEPTFSKVPQYFVNEQKEEPPTCVIFSVSTLASSESPSQTTSVSTFVENESKDKWPKKRLSLEDSPMNRIWEKDSIKAIDNKRKKPEKSSTATPTNVSRVDWEDKIPMDVISYINATDPNASNNIMLNTEESGLVALSETESHFVISNVTSENVIDLC